MRVSWWLGQRRLWGRPEGPNSEQRVGKEDPGSMARVVAVGLQDCRRSATHFSEYFFESLGGREDMVGKGAEGACKVEVRLWRDGDGGLEDAEDLSGTEEIDRWAEEWEEGVVVYILLELGASRAGRRLASSAPTHGAVRVSSSRSSARARLGPAASSAQVGDVVDWRCRGGGCGSLWGSVDGRF